MPDGELHSALGASSAERWLHCPGSVGLINAMRSAGVLDDDDSEYTEEGTQAHALAARCLNEGIDTWEAIAEFPKADPDAVQVYLDYAREIVGGRHYVELQVAHTAFHPQMFGTLDYAMIDADFEASTEFIDYKHGVGVIVDVERNAQLMYYAFAFLNGEDWPADLPRLPDEHPIRLTICQPRVTWMEPVRSWDTTAGEIRQWAYDELRGAMERAGEQTFKLGEHCRFCPAKLVCPAMRHLATDAALAKCLIEPEEGEVERLPSMDDEWLGQWYGRLPNLRMFIKAIDDETKRRMLSGGSVIGAKLVLNKVDRVWKEEAQQRMLEVFGDDAYEPKALRSPAQLEKLPGGKDFVAEYAMKPAATLTVAPESDKRQAQKYVSDEEMFAGVAAP